MLIIVEGSNKVGKSTIINKLAKLHNVSTIYNRNILKEMVDPKQEAYISAIAMLDVIKSVSKTQNIILDRFHLSEYVYGYLKRGYDNSELFRKIDTEISNMDCLLVLVTSDYKHLEEIGKQQFLDEYNYIQRMLIATFYTSKIKDKLMIKLEDVE